MYVSKDLSLKLKRIDNFEIRIFDNKKKENVEYILKNSKYDIYMVINEYDYFIWNCLDGTMTIQDIHYTFYERFNRVSVSYVENIINNFCEKGLIENYECDPKKFLPKKKVLEIRFPIKHIANFFEIVYYKVAHLFFNKIWMLIAILISVTGLLLYFYIKDKPPLVDKKLTSIVILYFAVMIPVFFHELSHALFCYHYNRKVKEAGIMIYMFMPVLYVNTSDIWMADRKHRIIVSLVGPLCDFLTGSVCSILFFFFYAQSYSIVFYQAAVTSYMRMVFNLNPLMKWDGYYCLMDLMGIYNLKERSSKFIFHDIVPKLKRGIKFTREEYYMLIYGTLSLVYVMYFLGQLIILDLQFFIKFDISHLNQRAILNLLFLLPIIFMPIKRMAKIIRNRSNVDSKLNIKKT
ncbi:hypothetical protein EHE19_015085 [Ruminiclostridium herbifermentans]|uniref:Peptidase M50 domain-containing protein n=1 Tax=Ruminiclostridium herbifermentans TaxID=2488810 RepID=A0A4U7JHK7_9FIRM|nr:site-2 protease family protein [Ruminiclostridium herbifermentans]QNU66191.1 hypothetical protein EHE19_015085 [Ruminiclostridium herbifermentans]